MKVLGLYVVVARMFQASWVRSGKHQQEQNSPNHIIVLFPSPVYQTVLTRSKINMEPLRLFSKQNLIDWMDRRGQQAPAQVLPRRWLERQGPRVEHWSLRSGEVRNQNLRNQDRLVRASGGEATEERARQAHGEVDIVPGTQAGGKIGGQDEEKDRSGDRHPCGWSE